MVHAWSWGLLSFSGFPVPGEIRKQLPPAPPSERFQSHKCRILGFDIEALMKKLKLHYSSFLLTPNTVYTPRKNQLFCRPRATCSETYEASAFAAKMSFTSRYSSSCKLCLLNSKEEAKNSADTFTTLFYGINRQYYLNIGYKYECEFCPRLNGALLKSLRSLLQWWTFDQIIPC